MASFTHLSGSAGAAGATSGAAGAAGGADGGTGESPQCNIEVYPPDVLFKALANVSGPTPNVLVSIHGGTSEESNYKAFAEWTKPYQTKATKGKAPWSLLTRANTVTVPADLIVVKIQKEYTNCVTDIWGWMEDDLRYLFSSPFWPLATGAASGQILDDSLLKHAQVYLPGDKFYNQWLQFDEEDYMGIWKIPGGPGVEPENLRGQVAQVRVPADPMRSYPDGAFPDGGAGGGMGDIPGIAEPNDSRAQYLAPGAGVTLLDWSLKATSAGDEGYEHADWRHFDMQTLLNYLSMPGYTQGSIAPGPWFPSARIKNLVAKGGEGVLAPVGLRVVYFFSCSPAPTSDNLHKESKALLGKHDKKSRQKVAEYIRDIRLKYRDAGHRCFLALRAQLQRLGRIAPMPKLASWHAVTAETPEEKRAGVEHFKLYWENREDDEFEGFPEQSFTDADESSQFTTSQIVRGLEGGGRVKKRRRRTRTRRRKRGRSKRGRKRRRRRTRRKRRKRKK